MKLVIKTDETISEDEIHLSCKELSEEIIAIQKLIQKQISSQLEMVVYKEDIEYFVSLKDVLFFETSGRDIMAHTKNDSFLVKKKLYELEEYLPTQFERISKSCIVNVLRIYSINKNVVSNGLIEFKETHKQVYVSRMYYKNLKLKLELRRNIYE